jgi:beta-fructofuranosidase
MNRRELLKTASGLVAAVTLRSAFLASCSSAPITARSQADLAHDPRRPQFHLLPSANWMNDPNGPIYWRGQYHMFFQYNPNGADWGDMHWAHATSSDMVHWKHQPVALAPTPGGPDADGCFSGTAVVNNGEVVLLYTGVTNASADQATLRDGVHSFRETQCLATSSDPQLNNWTKLTEAVIASPPTGMAITGFRDPSVWRSVNWWYLTIGSGTRHIGGNVLLYRSTDLRHWEYMHVLVSGQGLPSGSTNPVASGDMWECPELFPLGGKHVLIYSSMGKVHWQSGRLDEGEMKFYPEKFGIVDDGSYYAAKTQLDSHGVRILWGWIREARPTPEYVSAGWAGMMSLPRELSMGDDGWLNMQVASEVESLRQEELKLVAGTNVAAQLSNLVLRKATGEMLAKLKKGQEPFTISFVGTLPDGELREPLLTLQYDPGDQSHIIVDGKTVPIPGTNEDSLQIHAYFDGSIAELFLQRGAACSKRFYYPGSSAPDVRLALKGPEHLIESLSIWPMKPISSDRLTT